MNVRIVFLFLSLFLPYISTNFSHLLTRSLPSFLLFEVTQMILVTEKVHLLSKQSVEQITKREAFQRENAEAEWPSGWLLDKLLLKDQMAFVHDPIHPEPQPAAHWSTIETFRAFLGEMERHWEEEKAPDAELLISLDYFNVYGGIQIGKEKREFRISTEFLGKGRNTWVTGIEMNDKGGEECALEALLDLNPDDPDPPDDSYYIFLKSSCFNDLLESTYKKNEPPEVPSDLQILSFKMRKASVIPDKSSLVFVLFCLGFFVPNIMIQLTDTLRFFLMKKVTPPKPKPRSKRTLPRFDSQLD